jgi:hypothetical protein
MTRWPSSLPREPNGFIENRVEVAPVMLGHTKELSARYCEGRDPKGRSTSRIFFRLLRERDNRV